MIDNRGRQWNRELPEQKLLLFKPHAHNQIRSGTGAQSSQQLEQGFPFPLGQKLLKFFGHWRSHIFTAQPTTVF
jgi:hypothetical protein